MNNNSSLTAQQLGAVKQFYTSLTPAGVDSIADVYHNDIVFTDPAGTVRGLPALQRHFRRLMENTRQCSCVFDDDAQLIDGDRAVLCWRMTLQVSGLAGGRAFDIDGTSLLRYADGRIISHRDYFDLGALLYERLPLLAPIIRHLRRRLAAQAE